MNYLFHIILAISLIKNCLTQTDTTLSNSPQSSTSGISQLSSNSITSTISSTSQSNSPTPISQLSNSPQSSTLGISQLSSNSITSTTSSTSQSNLPIQISQLSNSSQSSTSGILQLSSNSITSTISSTSQSNSPTPISQINSTPTVASTSTLSLDEITSPFWVRTVCNITISTDITTTQFKSDMESRLSSAYTFAYNSIQTSGRRKRAVTSGTNKLQLVNAVRITNGQVPTNLVYYIVSSDNSYVLPSTIISNMNQLSLQQMSIYLGVPVTTVATYYNSATQNISTDDKLWIIGAVFGSLAAVAFIIWLVLFVYSRCIRPWDEPLILKSSVDLEDNAYLTEYSKSTNMNYETTVLPMVGTIGEKSFSNSKMIYKNDKIEKVNEKENKKEVKHEKIEKYNKFVEIEKSQIENRSTNEIVIKHVFEEKPRNTRKKHPSSSSSDSDSSSSKKSKKKSKTKEVKINENSEKEKAKPKKSKDNENKKSKKKKASKEITKKIEFNEESFVASTADTTMMSQKNDEVSEHPNNEEILVVEKMADILKRNIEKLPKVEDDCYVPGKERLQSPQLPEKLTVNVIEVQPKSNPTEDISKYELIEPKPVVNNYDDLKIFPSYSDEIYLVPDTSLNLVKLKTIDMLENNQSEMNQSKLKKSNLRTLDPLPREHARKY